MATTQGGPPTTAEPTPWVGWISFAAVMLLLLGTFNTIDGFTALLKDEAFVASGDGLLVFDLTAWGWIHLLFGAAQFLTGMALFRAAPWARIVAIGMVALNAVAQLAFLSAQPFWAVLIITLDMLTLWALVVHGDEAGPVL